MTRTAGDMLAIELDGAHLAVVAARVSRGGVEVLSAHRATRPSTVPAADASAVGRWIGVELKRAGITMRRTIIALPRAEVVLKSLALPGVGKARERDVAGMVRLQLSRQLAMSIEGAAIDYLVQPRGAGVEVNGGGDGIVLAAAMPNERLAWYREVAGAAGLKVARIGLRAHGVAMALAGASERRAGAVLALSPGSASVEFVVLEEGRLAFARAADVESPAPDGDLNTYADRAAVEAKRTWVSHRAGKNGGEPEGVVVLGQGPLAAMLAERCAGVLGVHGSVAGAPQGVSGVDRLRDIAGPALPLLGLLLEHAHERVSLDFAQPRRLPDTNARPRQLALAGAFAAIVLVGGGLTWARHHVQSLRAEAAGLNTRVEELTKQRDKFLLQHARLNHIEQWQSAKVDWLAHLRRLSDEMPDPRSALLDVVSGEMNIGEARYRPDTGAEYPNGTWDALRLAQISLAGKMVKRDVATDLRGRLVSGDLGAIYEVNNRGPDLPDRFSLDLVTRLAEPHVEGAKVVKTPTPPPPSPRGGGGVPPGSPKESKGGGQK